MKINKITKSIAYIFVTIMVFSLASCADELAELNEDPNAVTDLPIGLQLTAVQIQTPGDVYEMRRVALGWDKASIQQYADINTSTNMLPGDKYLEFNDYSSALFERYYDYTGQDLIDYVTRSAEDPADVNYHAMGLVMKVISMHKVTDTYGDVPYSEAGLGYIDNIWFPAYDRQEDIYPMMLKELETAASLFDTSAPNPGAQDVMYGGDLEKWKKLSYSMMLRLGLRMSKVDPAASEKWVKIAIAGGVMTELSDVAKVELEIGGTTNPMGVGFEMDAFIRISDTFISWLKAHGDPRLNVISFVETGGPHQGLPNGLDASTIETEGPAGGNLLDYSQVNPDLVKKDSPFMFITYAEVELMLAEAAVRGWYTGDAETHYKNGVRAAMENYEFYDNVTAPSTAQINAYLTANPFVAANAMEMIGEQYWGATFMVTYESYANWRRTGYPVLTPVNYPGNVTDGTIPRRMKYPLQELTINTEHVNAAIENQGPNEYTTRIWWDKK